MEEKIRALYEASLGIKRIGKELNISPATVRRKLIQLGLYEGARRCVGKRYDLMEGWDSGNINIVHTAASLGFPKALAFAFKCFDYITHDLPPQTCGHRIRLTMLLRGYDVFIKIGIFTGDGIWTRKTVRLSFFRQPVTFRMQAGIAKTGGTINLQASSEAIVMEKAFVEVLSWG